MARAIVPNLTRRPEASLSFYRIPGFSIRDHSLSVPLDWSRPEGRAITLFAREVTAPGHERADLPLLVFLQGGPGGKAPRPGPGPAWLPRAAERFRVILLDQRGTGRSSAVQGRQMAAMDAQAGARHLACFHADSIVRDCEYLRQTLFDGRTWFTLGQSYGGFLTLTYLSLAPQGLAGCFVAGGLPGLSATADQVYRRTYPRMAHKNALHVARHPQDRAILDRIADRLAGGDVRLPDGDLLSVRRFQHLGLDLGMADGPDRLHWLLDEAFGDDGELTDHFLGQVQDRTAYHDNPLFAAIHESIYAQHGRPTGWAAERVLAEFPDFAASARPLLLTGETIHPFLFDEVRALRPFGPAAHALARLPLDAVLYDPARLAASEVPVRAAIYADDMYVDESLSRQTAAALGNCRVWLTNAFEHDGLRASARVIDHLLGMEDGLQGFNHMPA